MKSCGVIIQMKASEQYFLVVLFIAFMPYKVVILPFASVDKILKCEHSNERSATVPSCCAVC